jgi:hypothetical protein
VAVALSQYSQDCKVKKKKVAMGFVLIWHFEDHKAHSPFNCPLNTRMKPLATLKQGQTSLAG